MKINTNIKKSIKINRTQYEFNQNQSKSIESNTKSIKITKTNTNIKKSIKINGTQYEFNQNQLKSIDSNTNSIKINENQYQYQKINQNQ